MATESAGTITELAAITGRTEQTVRNWLKRGDWPLSVDPPWDVADVRAWMATLAPNPSEGMQQGQKGQTGRRPSPELASDAAKERKAKLRLMTERTRKLELDRKIREGALIDAAERLRQELRLVHGLKAGLLEMTHTLGAELCELSGYQDRHAFEAVIDRRIRQLLNTFADGWTGERPIFTESEQGPKQ